MALHDLSAWRHEHDFGAGQHAAEWRTWMVVAITAVTMVAEIAGGWITGSMALLADGWHMGTHVVALAMAGIAYALARRWARDARFAFGTWKIEILGAFSSALLLALVAAVMVVESALRLVNPQPIAFASALVVAVIGFAVNVASAFVLAGGSGHLHDHDQDRGHGHGHDHDHEDAHGDAQAHVHGHGDLNLRAAYVHVLADALTSVLAIVALVAGMLAGWNWLDPVLGIVGAGVIAWWSKGVIVQSARVLLDREMDTPVTAQVRAAIEGDGDAQIADLHVWRVGRERYACIVAIVARQPLTPDGYRERLAGIDRLAHVSVEVNRCPHLRCP